MEYLMLVLGFIASNPIIATVLMFMFFFYDRKKYIELEIKSHEIRSRTTYNNLRFFEDILDLIITSSSANMIRKLNDNEYNYDETINRELFIYNSVLSNVFNSDIHALGKRSILKNGFNILNEKELEDLIQYKGKVFYKKSIYLIKVRTKSLVPNIYKHVGSNFSEEEAIEMWRKVIINCLKNYNLRDTEIENIRLSNKFNKILSFIKGIKNEK